MSQRFSKSLTNFTLTILFLCPVCIWGGKNESTFEGKIVGGSYTTIAKYAHAVFLSIKCGSVSMICGASIVNQHILLTAAHCLSDCHEQLTVEAYAGNENLKQVSVKRKVSKTAIHKSYSSHTLINDIALALLSQKLPLGNHIKRVIIKRQYLKQIAASVAGWGIVNDVTKERTMILKSVQQFVPPQRNCAIIGHIHKGMLCAGDEKRTQDRPSRGDSGSALVTQDYQQIGIVSFRNEQHPALVVYTDVSYFYEWIYHTSRNLYCSVNKKN